MNPQAITAALQALGSVLGLTATADGAVIRAGIVPDISTVDLKNYATGGLAEPILAPIRLVGALKNVGFPTGAIVTGDPTDPATRLDAAPLADAADLTAPGAQPDSPLQTVQGLLAGLEGLIPVGSFVPDLATVTASVCWHAEPDRECLASLPLAEGESPTGGGVVDGKRTCVALTTASQVEIPVVPPIVALKPGAEAVCMYQVSADVTLRAFGIEHAVTVGPIPVPVLGVGIPTVFVAFSERLFNTAKDGARLVIVPTDVPTQSLDLLISTLNEVQGKLGSLTGFVRIVGLLAGLGSVMNALRPSPVGSKHKFIFTSLDQHGDLGKLVPDWRHRPIFDDHGAEDDFGSLLMLSVDQRLELFEDQDFEDTRVDVRPSPAQFWIGISDFDDVTAVTPPDASGTSSGDTDFDDEAHSFRFQPR
jgi:hypothetical protein